MDEVRYAQRMADKMDIDLDDGDDAEQDEIRVRCSIAMKEQMEALAKAETLARELRGRRGKVSLNQLMKLTIERYIAAWAVDHKTTAPASTRDAEGIGRAARAINVRRAKDSKDGRAKT